MYKYILKVYGMRCGMCESHINDVIRRNFNVKRVNSSHIKNTTTIFTEEELSEDAIRKAISIGGDTDTIAAIVGSLAEAYYGIPDDIKEEVKKYLNDDIINLMFKEKELVK